MSRSSLVFTVYAWNAWDHHPPPSSLFFFWRQERFAFSDSGFPTEARIKTSQATQICIFRTSKSWKILRRDLQKRFSIVSVVLIHFYLTVIFERNVHFMHTNNLGVLDLVYISVDSMTSTFFFNTTISVGGHIASFAVACRTGVMFCVF